MTIEFLSESNYQDVEVLSEAKENGEKSWYISGTFIQEDVVNKNRRLYPGAIMEGAVGKYVNEYVSQKRAIGELNHPPTPEINPERASHLIESITKDGKNYVGKARILNTPMGNIAKGLLEGGVRLGVSSRGMGGVKKNSQGINEVQSNFKLATVDIVFQPSAPDAFVEGLMEGESFIWNTTEEDVAYLESLKEDIKEANKSILQEKKIDVFEKFLRKIKNGY